MLFRSVYALFGRFVVHDHCSALERVIDFGGVKTQGGEIAGTLDRFSVDLNPECVCCIIDHLKPILIRYLLNTLCIAGLPIYVHWHDGGRLRCDRSLDFLRINVARRRIYIYEDRFAAAPPNAVRGCDKAIGGGNHLARDVQCL